MKIRIAQLHVSKNVEKNKDKILEVINESEKDDWIIFPEGMLSGYYPEDDEFIKKLDWNQIENSIEEITSAVNQKSIQCIFGTVLFENDNWYNSAIFIDRSGVKFVYKKANLATLDRKCFVAGNSLDVYEAEKVKFGIQLCRDNAFPEQWKVLKKKGAQVVFHINNAIKENDINRKHVLISRAFENQLFVVSVNNASKPQTLPSLLISPFGEVTFESKPQEDSVNVVELDLSEVRSDYLEQERTDLVEVVYKG
jgi:predicted amidohydrolase